MVLLVKIVCSLIFCMIHIFSNSVAENESKNSICLKKVCPERSNPFDITRNDVMNGLTNTNSYETNPGDMFRDIGGNPNVKKVSEVYDNGFYTSLCWIEITTITEIKNGSKSAIREYAITFETPSDLPKKYISKKSELVDGETVKYKIFDRDTRKSEVVNFTTISKSKESIVRQNRKMLCGSGPIYTKEFMEWPHSDRKRVEIRVSPKKQNLVASNCIVLNANLENSFTLSPTRRDFGVTSDEPLTGEGFDENSLKYPTSESLAEITPKDIKTEPTGNKSKENTQAEQFDENTATIIQGISSIPSFHKTPPHESTTEPKLEYKSLKSDTFKSNIVFLPITKPSKQQIQLTKSDFSITHKPLLKPTTNEKIPLEIVTKANSTKEPESKDYEHLGVTKNLASGSTAQTYVTGFQPNVTIKNLSTEIINNESVGVIGSQTTSIENQTEHYQDLHFTKLVPNMEDKYATQVVEHNDVTEIPKNIVFSLEPTKLPINKIPNKITNRISSTTASDKNQYVEQQTSRLTNNRLLPKFSSQSTFNPDLTPHKYQVTKSGNSTEYTAANEQHDKQFKPEKKNKLILTMTSQQPQKSSLLPDKIQDHTQRNIVEKESTRLPVIITTSYDVSYVPTGVNVILNKSAILFTTPSKSLSLESVTKHPESTNNSDVSSYSTGKFIGSELISLSKYNNPITTAKSIVTTDKVPVNVTAINLIPTKTASLSQNVTFNTPVTKKLRPGFKLVTTPPLKYYTIILKNVDSHSLRENNERSQPMEADLNSITTGRIEPTNTDAITTETTVSPYKETNKSYSPKTGWEILPTSTPFSASNVIRGVLFSSSKNENFAESSTTAHGQTVDSATKRLRAKTTSLSNFVTIPATKNSTKIIDQNRLKENNGQGETYVKSSTTEKIEPTSAVDIKRESTVSQYEEKIKPYSHKTPLEILPSSSSFYTSNVITGTLLPFSGTKNFVESLTTLQSYTNQGLNTYTTIEVPDTYYSPVNYHFTSDNLRSTTKHDILKHGQIVDSATKRLSSEGVSFLNIVTTPVAKYNTKIIKNVDHNNPKEGNSKHDTLLTSSTTEAIPTITVAFKEGSTVGQYKEKIDSYTSQPVSKNLPSLTSFLISNFVTDTLIPSNKDKTFVGTSESYPYEDRNKDATMDGRNAYHSPVDNHFTGDILGSPIRSTIKYDTVVHGQTAEMVSEPPYIDNFSDSKGLLDQTQHVTKDLGILKNALSQVKPSQRPVDNEILSDQKETTIKNLEISKPEYILTELPFTSSRKPIDKNYTNQRLKNSSGLKTAFTYTSPQPVQKTNTFSYLSDRYTTKILLKQTDIKDRVSETYITAPGNVVHQFKGITEQPSKLRNITDLLSNLSQNDTVESATASDKLLDITEYSSTPNSLTSSEFQLFYEFFPGESSSDIYNSETVMPFKLNASDNNSLLHDSTTTTERIKPEQNTPFVNAYSIAHVSTLGNSPNISPLNLLNEMQTTIFFLEKPKPLKIKVNAPDDDTHSTNTYFTTDLDNLSNVFQSTTKIRHNILNEKQSTKSGSEKPTHTKTGKSSEPISSYITIPKSTTDYSKSYSKHIFLKPKKIKNPVDLHITTSDIPSSAEYIFIKPAPKTDSNEPNIYTNDVYFTEAITSTERLLHQFGSTTGTSKYPSEYVSIREIGSTAAEKLLVDQHRSTTKNTELKQQLHSKLPLKHPNHTTSTESFISQNFLDKNQKTPKYVLLNQEASSGPPLEDHSDISFITDFTSSENPIVVFHGTTQRTKAEHNVNPPIPYKHIDDIFTTRSFTSSERLLGNYESTITDAQLDKTVSSELPIPSDTSFTDNFSTSEELLDLFQRTTQHIKPESKGHSRQFPKHADSTFSTVSVTSPQSLLSNQLQIKTQRSHHRPGLNTAPIHTGNSAVTENSVSETLSDQLESTTELSNIKQKLHSKIAFTHPNDAYFIKNDIFSEKLPETFRTTTKTLTVRPQNSIKPKLKGKYFTSDFTTTSSLLNYPQTTITNMHPLSPVSLENLNNFQDTNKNLKHQTTNFELFESNSIPDTTESSTDRLTHILKDPNKSLCTNTKQKVLVSVKILMEHILQQNESGTIKEDVIPLMGLEKKTAFDIKPKKQLPVVPEKKLNKDWNIFLGDLARNFFDINRHLVPDFTDLKPTNLNLDVPGYEFGGKILSPKESIGRMQRIRNLMNSCKNKRGNRASGESKFISEVTVDNKSPTFRNEHAVDNANNENNLKLTHENLSSDFYRFLLDSPPRNAELEDDNKLMKVKIPTKLLLPLNDHSKMEMVKVLHDRQRNTEYITPIPGSYRAGYKQFSLSDLFPISANSKRFQYLPTLFYPTAFKIAPEILRSYPPIKDYDLYNVLSSASSSYNPQSQMPVNIAPRFEENRKSNPRNPQYATSIAYSFTNDDVDFQTDDLKTFEHKHKVNNNNLNQIQMNQDDYKSIAHTNNENIDSALGKLSNNETEEMNNFLNNRIHNAIVDNNSKDSDHQKIETVYFNPIIENDKSGISTHYKFFNFKGILDGIINKLNTVLEKISKT